MRRATRDPLYTAYDLAMLDLDGVVYIGDHAVKDAPRLLSQVRRTGMHLAFITNNAARTPEQVAAHLVALGVEAEPADVVTSAQAAARLVAGLVPRGAAVLLAGGAGLEAALVEEGLMPVTGIQDGPRAVATGYGPELPWRRLMEAAVLIRDGRPWVASNADLTIPTGFGVAPGHGVVVRMLTEFTGVRPVVAGKPERPLLDETVRRVGGERPLMVGDRLDTDIEGANRAGYDSLLVLTGVTGLEELVAAPPQLRPTYLSLDLGGLLSIHGVPQGGPAGWSLAGWTAGVSAGRLRVAGSGEPDDWWRVAAAAAWTHLDEHGVAASVDGLVAPVPSGEQPER